MSGFNFGQQASSGAPSGSLFGTSGSSGNAGGNLFGGGSTGFSFGAQNTSSAGESKSLFGSTTDNKSGGNLFGQPSPAAAGPGANPTFSFGKKDDQGGNSGSSSIFGTPKAATPSFGPSTTPAPTTSQPSWSFGNPSTTPAGPPPQPSTFGASTGGTSNIFGNKSGQDNTSKTPTFSFKPADNNSAPQSGAAPQSSTSNLFGAPQSNQPGASPAPSLFGSASNQPEKPAEQSNAASAPPAGQKFLSSFSFPQPAAPASNPTSGSSTPNMFAPPPSKPAASPLFNAPSSTTQPSTSQSSGPSLFTQPSTTSSAESTQKAAFSFPAASTQSQSSSDPATSSEPSKPLFGGLGGAPSSSAPSKPLFGAAPTASAGPAPSTTAAATNATTTSSTPGFSFGPSAAPTLQAPASTSGLAASTSGPLPQPQSRLKNKTMDEILTRWATDLTKYTKEFKNHSETVAKWDQVIVDNSSRIDKLYVKTRTCEKQTMSVEMQLSAVENQQTELESWLTKYENDVEAMLSKEGATPSELGGPDQERERTYKLAEKLAERLDDMGQDLSSMVDEVNAANASLSKNGKADEPITQIVRILNSHLSQLQAIDQGTATLQARVAEAQKAANGLGYLNGGANGDGRAAVDDFYRSYMGRR